MYENQLTDLNTDTHISLRLTGSLANPSTVTTMLQSSVTHSAQGALPQSFSPHSRSVRGVCPLSTKRVNTRQTKCVNRRQRPRQPTISVQASASTQSKTESFQVTLDTEVAQKSLLFAELNSDKDKVVVVRDVAKGSPAEEAGVQPGQKVMGISDPVNRDQMLELNVRPSKRSVQRALQMRASPTIDFIFSTDLVPEADQALQDNESVADRLDVLQRKTAKAVPVSEERAQSLNQYREEEAYGTKETRGKKNKFAIATFAIFFLLPASILAFAIGSGYLKQLGGGYGV